MATYNGRKYLKQQIDSIFAQSNQQWQLLLRDDGSFDDTINIIEAYMTKYPSQIRLITDNEGHLGASLNFGRLLEYSDTEYIMFSDQDDVWLPNKVEITLNTMKVAEQIYPDRPILIHTDLRVVDSDLNTIADSMWSYQKLFPDVGDDLNRIMAQNVVTGCTMMINRKAKAVSIPIPREAIMYDWWIAIKVTEHGKIIHIPDKHVLYRQHPDNLVGAKKAQTMNIWRSWGRLLSQTERKRILNYYRMVKIHNPHINLYLLVLKKILYKLGLKFR